MRRRSALSAALSLVAGAAVALVAAPAGAAVPAGFSDQLVASVGSPTALAFTPDGRLLVTTQGGTVRVVEDGALLPTPALNLSSVVCSNSERGLLGWPSTPTSPPTATCSSTTRSARRRPATPAP